MNARAMFVAPPFSLYFLLLFYHITQPYFLFILFGPSSHHNRGLWAFLHMLSVQYQILCYGSKNGLKQGLGRHINQ